MKRCTRTQGENDVHRQRIRPSTSAFKHVLNNFYVGGTWIEPQSDQKLELISPITEECFVKVPEASTRMSIARFVPPAKHSITAPGRG